MSGAKKIGTDSLGNTYYQIKARAGYNHPRRWVVYKDVAEPSSVPPEWHGWLHYQSDYVPTSDAPSSVVHGKTGTSKPDRHKHSLSPTRHLLSGACVIKQRGL